MTEERLREIENRCVGADYVGTVDDLHEVFTALREAWRQIRTLDIPIEMIEDTPIPDSPGTVGEAMRKSLKRIDELKQSTEIARMIAD